MVGRIWVGMNIQIKWAVRSAHINTNHTAHSHMKSKLDSCFLDLIRKKTTYYFQLV